MITTEQIIAYRQQAEYRQILKYRKLETEAHKLIYGVINRLETDVNKRLKLYDYFNDKLNCISKNIIDNK